MTNKILNETLAHAAQTKRAKSLIKAMSLGVAILSTLMLMVSMTSVQKPPFAVSGITVALVLCQLLCYAIASYGDSLKLAAWLFSLSVLTAFTSVTAIMGGIHAPIILGIMVAPLCATLVLDFKPSLIILVLAVIAIIGFIVAEKMGYAFRDSGLTEQQRVVRSGIWEILFICMSFIALRRYDLYNHQFTTNLSEQAATDKMTGFYSKDIVEALLFQQVQVCRRSEQPLSVMIIDIDHFKQINDQFGHKEGDKYIESIAELIRQEVRRGQDSIGRIGGDEFMVLLPQTPVEGAKTLAENIRVRVSTIPLPKAIGGKVHLSLSIGVATYSGNPNFSHNDVFRIADESLYRSKELGRDQISCQRISDSAPNIKVAA